MDLSQQILDLAPWHYDLPIEGGLQTALGQDTSGNFTLINPGPSYADFSRETFGEKLHGMSVLDVACNCGGSLFYFAEAGARRCFGFDAREHWVRQGRFLMEHCALSRRNVEIVQLTLDQFLEGHSEEFDITLFNGIFYHLPDPVHHLRLVAERTRELIFVNTAIIPGTRDDHLTLCVEKDGLLQGIDGLSFVPSGPRVVSEILRWLGFEHTKVMFHKPQTRHGRGRTLVAGSRNTPIEAS